MNTQKNTKVFITAIKFNTTHYLANLLATRKILNIPMNIARTLCKNKQNEWIELVPYIEINSKNCLDHVIMELDEYEIEIKTLNQ